MMRWLEKWRSAKEQKTHKQAQTNPVFPIKGGIALSAMSYSTSASATINSIEPPEEIILPLLDYYQRELKPEVSTGQTVTAGMHVANGILSSFDGTVTAIEKRAIAHPSGCSAICVVIAVHTPTVVDDNAAQPSQTQPTDSKRNGLPNTLADSVTSIQTSESISLTLEKVRAAAIHGLGGAGFSTTEKLGSAADNPLQTLIINAVECEPLLSCDVALMISDADRILEGVRLLIRLLACKRCVIVMENNKTAAIQSMSSALKNLQHKHNTTSSDIQLQLISPVYPSGAERVLIHTIIGKDIQPPERPIDHGILVVNVATAHAACRAAADQAMLTRVVTIAGDRAAQPCNVRVHLGTPIRHVLEQTGNTQTDTAGRVRIGGPFSGYELLDTDTPVTATCNCLTLDSATRTPAAEPCIRCGACDEICPVNLLPQQLLWHARAEDLAGLDRFSLDRCMKCGCCDWACPSSIPLTDYFRFAQAFKQNSETRAAQARLAEQRHQQRQARQTARKQKRKLDIELRKARLHNRSHDKTTATPAKDRPQATVGNNSEDSAECTTDADLISATLNRIKQQRIAQANNRK